MRMPERFVSRLLFSQLAKYRGQIVPRNALRGPWTNQLDVSSSLNIPLGTRRLELSAAVDNLLQSDGYNSVLSQNFFATTFGTGNGWIEGRRMNFVARVKF